MFITVTALRLHSLWGFFRLSQFGLKITLQARRQPGFVAMKNTGFGYWHYTMSSWDSEPAMKKFSRSGAHLMALKASGSLASEVRILTYQDSELPDWDEAKQKVMGASAKVFNYPTP